MRPLWVRLNGGLSARGLDLSEIVSRCNFPAAECSTQAPVYNCAVSGGQDSLSLVVLAKLLELNPVAHHVDHGLRPGSHLEVDRLRAMLETIEVPLVAHSIAIEGRSNLEARARDLRYSVLPPKVATGHTLDDQAETVMINLLRGSGLRGLAGMQISESKPLLSIRRFETKAICEVAGFEPILDESNTDSRFLRNRVRHELLPMMADLVGRDVSAILARQSLLLAEEDEFLQSQSKAIEAIDPNKWREVDQVLLRRYLRSEIARICGVAIDHGTTVRVASVVTGQSPACNLVGGYIFRRRRGSFEIWEQGGAMVARFEVHIGFRAG